MAAAWQQTIDASALAAVASSRSLHQGLAQWQLDLVREALADGASWEDIGEALGTTRQAAWARFHRALDEGGQLRMAQPSRRERISAIKDAGIARIRQLEEQWQIERSRLRDEMAQTQRNLKEAQRLHTRRQKEARDELRRAITAASWELHAG
ncbi:MAG: hypothetical protein DLM65_01140 [Candidatus Aeolococcus gillhamiae]|uniref:Uncharacterized protein n=1 Tax=Candidatus Aeolococcus gillhamiae TaxID=3127015 RepID=A0A2W6B0B2_9BACT|nr:MAG: hypothetical protein DLM65_01140 [Candidatus Dormibacter sp. RRmetagenome_bin12]